MTTFPACAVPGCTHPAQVIRRTGGTCYVVHTCADHLYGQGFDSVEHAAEHWASTYGSNWAAAPRSEASEGRNGSAGETPRRKFDPLLSGSVDNTSGEAP